MKSEAEIQMDVLRWFRHWGQTATVRLHALLVAGYFRTRGPFGVEGEEKYLQLRQPHGRDLIELLEEYADRPFTTQEAEEFVQLSHRATQGFRRDAIVSSQQWQFRYGDIADCFRQTRYDPCQGAASLLRAELISLTYPGLQQVRECFCPADWLPAPEWTPPAEALSWAQRIYDQRAFGELPILADMLEDADCPDRSLLDHCRNCKAHFRGCAALDRLLGKA